uniref:UBX domain-containing protein n=1 Tax=Leersia perrieri TaxID=77586 RepID=A0A0D9XAH1_9ORYZ
MMELDEPFDPIPTFQMPFDNLFSVLDHSLLERAAAVFGQGPLVAHPRELRRIAVNDNNPQTCSSGRDPVIEDVTGHESSHGPEIHGTVVVDEDDDDNLPSAQDPHRPRNTSRLNYSVPSAPPSVGVSDYNNDIEEEMVRAAREASKRDAEGLTNGPSSRERENASGARDDDDIARAVSMSLETAEREIVLRQEGVHVSDHSDLSGKEDIEGATGPIDRKGPTSRKVETSEHLVNEENLQEDIEDVEGESLVGQRFRHLPSGNAESAETLQRANSHPSSPPPRNIPNNHQLNGVFPSEEWGRMSFEEYDEALMLEAAMLGGIPGRAAYPFSLLSHRNSSCYPTVVRPPSPTLAAQRLLREQQDDEYLASLKADQERELNAKMEAELCRLKAAQEEEEKQRKQLEEEELKSKLAAKQASLPKEPSPDDEGAITVVVRMPDGRRQGRRFLKSDNLQVLFDFIDISRTFKPGTYRLVRSYPRRVVTDSEGQMSLSDLGLTSKQEALFLEQISG